MTWSLPLREGSPLRTRFRCTRSCPITALRESAIVPDIVFGLELTDGSRRNFMVEIDRGTMPVRRSDPDQTSIERKMRVYLTAHAAKLHKEQFGWANFRVLFVTTNQDRVETM